MRAVRAIRFARIFFMPNGGHITTHRIQHSFSRKLFSCQAKFADSEVDRSVNFKVVAPALVTAEKEEAKAVLALFLKKQGLSNANAARTIKKSDLFIDHLVLTLKLHLIYKSRYLVGRELTALKISNALNPYLESLLKEHGTFLAHVVKKFPNPPIKDKTATIARVSNSTIDTKKQRAISRVSEIGPTGELRPQILYLIEYGLNLEQIKEITRRFPSFGYYTLEGKIKPLIEFLLGLGVPKSAIPAIINRRPQLCGISLTENLKPTMLFLEKLGVDKKQWAKVIYRFPALLTYSKQKVEATIDFLYEMGLSEESVGKVLTRCPNIISSSVEEKLRPTADYFRSLGVDVAVLLYRSPQTFGLRMEANLKPVTQFFLERGYSMEDVGTMASRFGSLYTFSLAKNLVPKWDFFLTMDYSKSELIKFPQYFGYSLEGRIKPRFAIMKESQMVMPLNKFLAVSEGNFLKVIKNKMNKNKYFSSQELLTLRKIESNIPEVIMASEMCSLTTSNCSPMPRL